ncbi:MAG: PP2C family protein-serine/threonine phosphatase, partial [Lachnospiraceae bacterium]|nr:PP2C family protein-serine/threonine phosphatase [Lachnospiraceae bacterium]
TQQPETQQTETDIEELLTEAELVQEPQTAVDSMKALPEIGIGFAAGLAVALVFARLTRARRKTTKTERVSEESGKQVALPENKPTVSEAVSSIGKAHGIGMRRDQQDSFYASELTDVGNGASGDMLAIVADGIGGLKNGAIVSTNVVRLCTEIFYQNIETMEPEDVLLKMTRSVKEEVSRLQQSPGESGSTMVIGVIWKGVLYFLTVGDSRIWLWRNGGLIQLNREHIYQEELALKVINHQDGIQSVKLDHQRKLVTSFIGQSTIKYIDRNPGGIVLQKGDKVLLASDGVFGTIDERSLERMLYQTAENAAKSIQEAVEQKNRAGQDNYTAVILEYQG